MAWLCHSSPVYWGGHYAALQPCRWPKRRDYHRLFPVFFGYGRHHCGSRLSVRLARRWGPFPVVGNPSGPIQKRVVSRRERFRGVDRSAYFTLSRTVVERLVSRSRTRGRGLYRPTDAFRQNRKTRPLGHPSL